MPLVERTMAVRMEARAADVFIAEALSHIGTILGY
jgi:hypothetical protein